MLTTRPPRARHDGTRVDESAIETLLRRSQLATEQHSLRMAGLPLLMAAVVAGGPGWTTYFVEPGDTLNAIARRHGTDAHSLARLNGVTDREELLAGARLTVPVPPANPGSTARRKATALGLHPVEVSGVPQITYRVKAGDTVSGIALATRTSERAILSANGLKSSAMIRVGQLIVLPSLPVRTATTASVKPGTRPVVHVVQPGDTVYDVARRYQLDQDVVLKANRLTASSIIRPGQKLVLPGAKAKPRPAVSAASSTSVHVVRRGETVTAIARRYGVSVPAVLTLNHLRSRTIIFPGRRLLIPAGSGQARPKTKSNNSFLGRTYPDAVVAAADANRRALKSRATPTVAQAKELVRSTARQYGLNPALALAVAQTESSFDQRQVSPANAVGLMQVIPSSGAFSSEIAGRPLDLLDPEDNVTAGVVLLASLVGATHDENQAIAGYYQGLASVKKNGMFADTRRYVATVRTLTQRFQ